MVSNPVDYANACNQPLVFLAPSQGSWKLTLFCMEGQEEIDFVQTICDPSETGTVMRKNKDGPRTVVSCPLPVKIYNEKMGGVDLADCKRQVYSCSRKSKKWWHRLFYFFLDVGV